MSEVLVTKSQANAALEMLRPSILEAVDAHGEPAVNSVLLHLLLSIYGAEMLQELIRRVDNNLAAKRS